MITYLILLWFQKENYSNNVRHSQKCIFLHETTAIAEKVEESRDIKSFDLLQYQAVFTEPIQCTLKRSVESNIYLKDNNVRNEYLYQRITKYYFLHFLYKSYAVNGTGFIDELSPNPRIHRMNRMPKFFQSIVN